VKADGVFCEPVSNSSLLYGAARGSGKEFGAHIPGDWYLGYPHDMNAVRRFRLLLQHASGEWRSQLRRRQPFRGARPNSEYWHY